MLHKNQLKLDDVDHWDLLVEISNRYRVISDRIMTIHDSMVTDEIKYNRTQVAKDLADMDVLTDIIRYKLSIMDGEWGEVLADAENETIALLTKDDKNTYSLEDIL